MHLLEKKSLKFLIYCKGKKSFITEYFHVIENLNESYIKIMTLGSTIGMYIYSEASCQLYR